jgi:hypothetical protein
MIKVPLVFEQNSSVVKYPTARSQWEKTFIDDGFLVGHYEGPLYLADGVTKTFNWAEYIKSPINYGTLMTSLAFFDRMMDVEERFLREAAKINIDMERLLARAERLTDNVDVARDDVKNGVHMVLQQMLIAGVPDYNAVYVEQRKFAILELPISFTELPEKLQLQFSSEAGAQ